MESEMMTDCSPIALENIAKKLKAAEAEIERLNALLEERFDDVRLVRYENGQFDFSDGPIPYIAAYLAEMFDQGDGANANYFEVGINHRKVGPMTLTVQRTEGKTPHQLRKEAEAERDALKNEGRASTVALDWVRLEPLGNFVATVVPFGKVRVTRYNEGDPYEIEWSSPGFQSALIKGTWDDPEGAKAAASAHIGRVMGAFLRTGTPTGEALVQTKIDRFVAEASDKTRLEWIQSYDHMLARGLPLGEGIRAHYPEYLLFIGKNFDIGPKAFERAVYEACLKHFAAKFLGFEISKEPCNEE